MKSLLFLGAVIYLVGCVFVYLIQRKLIYFSSSQNESLPDGFVSWHGTNGFIGFKSEKGSTNALLFFQGNGGNASGWAHALTEFPGDVFILEYPGYGERSGTSSQESIGQAAIEAFDSIPKGKDILVCGQSLGTGVAAQLIQHRTVSKLLLITPFTSLSDMAKSQYPFFPVSLMLKDPYPVLDIWLMHSNASCVFIAQNDEIIPQWQSKKFSGSCNNEPARFHYSKSCT